MQTDDERTTDVGLFNQAHSYFSSANSLSSTKVRCTHPHDPMNYLYAHAIELYLKSFLKLKETSLAELKRIGHNPHKLTAAAIAKGLVLNDLQEEQIKLGCDSMKFRYIQTGLGQQLLPETYQALGNHLHLEIGPQIYNGMDGKLKWKASLFSID